MHRLSIILLLLVMLSLSGCRSVNTKQIYYYPPEKNNTLALDNLAEEFKGLNIDQLDEFFNKWSELSSSIAASRQLCELDSIILFVWNYYSDLELRRRDTSRYITISEKIKVHYFDRPLRDDTFNDPLWPDKNKNSPSLAKDTLILDYTPILIGEHRTVLYKNRKIHQLLRFFVDGSEEKANILRSYIPVDFMMEPTAFVNSVPDIYGIHFYENGIMVDSQVCGTYESEVFFPADSSTEIEVGGLLQ